MAFCITYWIIVLFSVKLIVFGQDACTQGPNVVPVCSTDIRERRQLFLPFNDQLDAGCECKIQLVRTPDATSSYPLEFSLRGDTNFTNACDFNIQADFNDTLNNMDCKDNEIFTNHLETHQTGTVIFTGTYNSNYSRCLHILSVLAETYITVECGEYIRPNTTFKPTSTTVLTTTVSLPPPRSPQVPPRPPPPSRPTRPPTPQPHQPPQPSTTLQTSTYNNTITTPQVEEDNGLPTTLILVGSSAGVLVILMIICCVVCGRKKKKEKKEDDKVIVGHIDAGTLENVAVENQLFVMTNKNDKITDRDNSNHDSSEVVETKSHDLKSIHQSNGSILQPGKHSNGSILISEKESNGSVLKSESQANGSVLKSESQVDGSVVKSENQSNGSVLKSEGQANSSVLKSEKQANGSTIKSENQASKSIHMLQNQVSGSEHPSKNQINESSEIAESFQSSKNLDQQSPAYSPNPTTTDKYQNPSEETAQTDVETAVTHTVLSFDKGNFNGNIARCNVTRKVNFSIPNEEEENLANESITNFTQDITYQQNGQVILT